MQLEWYAHLLLTYLLIYGTDAWYAKVLLLPWSIYSALALDSIIHNVNHWPPPPRWHIYLVWRWSAILLGMVPLSIKYQHWVHHRSYDLEEDPQNELRRICATSRLKFAFLLGRYVAREVGSSIKDLIPGIQQAGMTWRLRVTRPADYYEIIASQWLRAVLIACLLFADPYDTICFFIPVVVLVPPVVSNLMNLTDHLPAQLDHPFRQATYFHPGSSFERALCSLNHYTAATHLTHHLFPDIHFAFLHRLQSRLLPIYRRHEAPKSLIITTVLCGNPLALGCVFAGIIRHSGDFERWPSEN